MKDLLIFLKLHRLQAPRLGLAGGLAVVTMLAAVGLLALSGWFITASAIAGLTATAFTFDYFRPGAGVRGFALTRTVSRYFERLIAHDATLRVLARLRRWLFKKLMPLKLGELARLRSADALNRLTADIDALDGLYLKILSPCLVGLAALVLGCGFLFLYHPPSALAAACGLVLAGGVLSIYALRRGYRLGQDLAEDESALRVAMIDGLTGLADLKTNGAEQRHFARVEELSSRVFDQKARLERMGAALESAGIVLAQMTLLTVSILGLHAVEAGGLSGPEALMIGLCVLGLFEAVTPLPVAFQALGHLRRSARRLLELGEAETEPDGQAFQPALRDYAIRFERVSFAWPGRHPVLSNFERDIADGSLTVLIGPSGVGKSTLAALLVRAADPDAGRIILAGQDLSQISPQSLRAHIAYLPQDAHLFSASVRENLLLGNPTATQAEMMAVLELVGLTDFIDGLEHGLDSWVGEAGLKVSGGEARRIALARTLLKPAPILILDEPTTGIAPDERRALIEKLLQLKDRRQIILITHDLADLPAARLGELQIIHPESVLV